MSVQEVIIGLEARLGKWETGINDIKQALGYLRTYGYVKALEEVSIADVIEGVRKFQVMFGLDQDSELGPKTLKAMTWPRCGLPDFAEVEGNILSMETLEGKWGRKNITYYIESRDNDVTKEEWDNTMALAFKHWSDVANLKFNQTLNKSNAQIIIGVGSGIRNNFDGPNGTLAWAQLPPSNSYNGQLIMKFDAAETWVVDLVSRGIRLENVAAHEIGHTLGLGHSRINAALMAPFYNPAVNKPVHNDDVIRIQRLYGPPVGDPNPTPEPEPPPTPEPPSDIPAPSDLSASQAGEDKIQLQWKDNSIGENAFEVFRNDVMQGEVGRGRTKALDIGVGPGTYNYKVRARKGSEHSDFSNVATVTIAGDTPPEPEPEPEPEPNEELVIKIEGNIKSIEIPGYEVKKLG